MNTKFPANLTAVTLVAHATNPWQLEAANVPFAQHPDSSEGLIDGRTYHYFVRWPDNETSGFEEGYGIFSSSGNGSISRVVPINSTNGPGTLYDFAGNTGPKHISIVTSGSELAAAAQIHVALNPWEEIFIWITSQSNGGYANFYQSTPPASNPFIKDWSTDGTEGTAFPTTYDDLAWRVPNLADDYEPNITDYMAANNGIYTGLPRSYNFGGSLGTARTGSIGYAFANYIQRITGRRVRTVSTYRNGTALDAAEGWLYPSGLTGVKAVADMKAALAAYVAENPTRNASVTHPHYMLIAQGETDQNSGKSSSDYAFQLFNFIRSCEDTTQYNATNRYRTRYLIFDTPLANRILDPHFNGHRAAAELIGSRAQVISTENSRVIPGGFHYYGESADDIGIRAALSCTTAQERPQPSGAWKVVPDTTALPSGGLNNYYVGQGAASYTAPPAGAWVRTPDNKLRIHKQGAFGSSANWLTLFGLQYMIPNQGINSQLILTTYGATVNDSTTFTIGSTARVDDAGGYLEWVIASETNGSGTPPANNASVILSVHADVRLLKGTVSMVSDFPVGSANTVQRTTDAGALVQTVGSTIPYGQAFLDTAGALQRGIRQTVNARKRYASTVSVGDVLISLDQPVNSQFYIESTIVGLKETTDTLIFVSKWTGISIRGASGVPTVTQLSNTITRNTEPLADVTYVGEGVGFNFVAYPTGISGVATVWTAVMDIIVCEVV